MRSDSPTNSRRAAFAAAQKEAAWHERVAERYIELRKSIKNFGKPKDVKS